ncbi:ATP-binding protein [Nigerium massiliense]|uniref:ATP-binding protein n=1 Tax=Nigerium massiliense TaxID=1522317 RepID=UPI00058E842B|nr:ATP-binding protein [Nigerium massiliense]
MTQSDAEPAAGRPASLVRVPERGWLGGVCAGLAGHLGMPATLVRLIFALLASWRLVGVLAYLALWLALPRERSQPSTPGLDAATRRGLRGGKTVRLRSPEAGQTGAVVMVGAGMTWLVQWLGWGLPAVWFVAGVLLALGAALVWWQADRTENVPFDLSRGPLGLVEPLVRHWTTVLSLVLGLFSVSVAVGLVAAMIPGVGDVGRMLWAIVLSLVALIVLAAPWLLRVRRSLTFAREEKLVSDARADMAAHLHDSVLQTLALIQRQADDRDEVVRLARRQERELREWLYGEELPDDTLKSALAAAAQDVEDNFPVTVDCVTVGDIELDARFAELVRAAREAMWNAAKHSGTSHVDVYAEVEDDGVTVFVRDRGWGFDPDDIPEGRMGIKRSIVERVRRHHGNARIRSSPQTGTEVMVEMRT